MSARAEIELALENHFRREDDPRTAVRRALGRYNAERQAEALRAAADAPEARTERYIAALRSADMYALVERRDDLKRFAEAVIAVANDETDPVYRSGYAAGRMHAGGGGRLRDFTAVWTTSDGGDCPATELRCVLCGGLVQGVGPHTLLDLMALAAQHDCQTTGGA